ncbi:MAG: translocation/assembly module TamB domain-containing protein [Barnesiella sp.]
MRKWFKYTLIAIVSFLILLLLLPLLIYLPPVQKWAKNELITIVSEKTGMALTIEDIHLAFPFDLSVRNSLLLSQSKDTILKSGDIKIDIELLPLFHKQLNVQKIDIRNTSFKYITSDSTLSLSAKLQSLILTAGEIDLKNESISIPYISLNEGNVVLHMKESSPDTTVKDNSSMKWKIKADRISLNKIFYEMKMLPVIDLLTASVPQADLRKGLVDMGEHIVNIKSITLEQGAYRYLTPPPALVTINNEKEKIPADSITSAPWTVTANSIKILHNQAIYAENGYRPLSGFDPKYIEVSDFSIVVDSFYNKGTEITVPIRQLAFNERSGISVIRTSGTFIMDSTRIALQKFSLATRDSELSADLSAGGGLLTSDYNAPVSARINAWISLNDISSFYGDTKKYTQSLSPASRINMNLTATGSLKRLNLSELKAELPSHFLLHLSGNAQNITEPKKLSASVQLNGNFTNMGFIRYMVPDTALQNRLSIPSLTLKGEAKVLPDDMTAHLICYAGKGKLALEGSYSPQKELYDATLSLDSFPLFRFLPKDSLGYISSQIEANGKGFDFLSGKTTAQISAKIRQLQYKAYDFNGIQADVSLADNRLIAGITSLIPDLKAHLEFNGYISKQKYTGNLTGNIPHMDLQAVKLSTTPLKGSMNFSIKGNAALPDQIYDLEAKITKLELLADKAEINFEQLLLKAETDSTHIKGNLRSGDMSIDFSAPSGPNNFLSAINRTIPILNEQVNNKRLDIESLQHAMPDFSLSVNAARKNLLNQYLSSMGMNFHNLNLKAENDSLLNLSAGIDRFQVSGIILDTVRMKVNESNERLYYHLNIRNRPDNLLGQTAAFDLDGYVSGNSSQFLCIQKNQQGNEGFHIGCKASLQDSLLRISFFPNQPIIGFESWNLNEDNFFEYKFGEHFDANIRLEHNDRHLIVETQHKNGFNFQEALHVDMKGVDIESWLQLSPFAPPVAGLLSANLLLNFPQNTTNVKGSLGIENLKYDKQRIGTVNMEIAYQLDSIGRQQAALNMDIDGKEVARIGGYYAGNSPEPLNITLKLNQLPLSTANPFLPGDMAHLQGGLNGEISVTGKTESPLLNGWLQTDTTAFSVPMIGTSYNLSDNKILIDEGILHFDEYSVTGPNQKPLYVSGDINLKDFSHIYTDLRLHASEFQPIRVDKNSKSMVYGKAIIDLETTVKGPLDRLTIRGNVDLLNGTEVTYVMRDSPLELKQQENNMVTFVAFNDSTAIEETDSIPKNTIIGMDILMNLNIAPSVKMAINLSADGSNRIDLEGGGSLTYTMNTLGDSRFTGKYVLSGGYVRYNPPIISQKLFKIQQGSDVTWNGNMLDPILNITAIETLRTSVTEENQNSRIVNFDISIEIKNTLERLSVSFGLSAPQDLTIQNQLQSLTAEQRASQAMNLLLYNTYTGPGTTAKANLTGNPLNSFLQKELNQWAQNNLKNIDLSFGISEYDDQRTGGATTRTDYSYKVSKTLFDDRFKVVIGGSFSPDATTNEDLKENLIDDISLEYMLNKRENMYIKIFRHNDYESILEGEITQTGVGFVVRKKLSNLLDLFRFSNRKKKKN